MAISSSRTWTNIEATRAARPDFKEDADFLVYLPHSVTFSACVLLVDRWMRKEAPSENVVLVAEDTNKVKTMIKRGVHVLRNPKVLEDLGIAEAIGAPVLHVVDTVHYATKTEAAMLQLADMCAFFVKRHVQEKADSELSTKPFSRPSFIERPSRVTRLSEQTTEVVAPAGGQPPA